MTTTEIRTALLDRLDSLPPNLQQRVLDFADALAKTEPRGAPGKSLRRFAGTLDPESARQMQEAIEEGCERIDADGW